MAELLYWIFTDVPSVHWGIIFLKIKQWNSKKKQKKTFNICCRWISSPSHACLPSSSAWTWTWATTLEVRFKMFHFYFLNKTAKVITKYPCIKTFKVNAVSADHVIWNISSYENRLHDVLYLIPIAADSIPSISEDTAREAFVLFASSKCCYSAAPAKDGVITSMEAFNTYRVRGCQLTRACLGMKANKSNSWYNSEVQNNQSK